jgi:hypothetical protein
MTVGLVPILWSTDAGADLMKRIAAPMVGGLTTSFLMELLVYPVLYMMWREREVFSRVASHSDFAEQDFLSGSDPRITISSETNTPKMPAMDSG